MIGFRAKGYWRLTARRINLVLRNICYCLLVMLFASCSVPSNDKQGISEEDGKDKELVELISGMTLEEKISMVHGDKGTDPQGRDYVGYLPGIPRLDIPPLRMQPGPQGAGATFSRVRHLAPATAFPVPIAQASTWNTELLYKFGNALGLETRAQCRDVSLGGGVNIIRIPEGGRNFEYLSEDPYLSAKCIVPITKGIQDVGIMSCVKHFVANNQDTWRHTIDEMIPDRALHEIYLPAFKAAVEDAQVSSIMVAYNKINGIYCTENPYLLKEVVRDRWRFKGFIMTDWGTRHDAVTAANAGLDLEMSGWGKFGEPQFREHLLPALQNGLVEESTIDRMVYHILREMKRFGHLGQRTDFPPGQMDTPEHRKLAFQMAVEGAVLLKNEDSTLPLDPAKVRMISLFGDADTARVTGGGSSKVVPFYSISPLEGIRGYLNKSKVHFYRDPADIPPNEKHEAGIIFIHRFSTETADRESISLEEETEMIEKVAQTHEKTIVILRTPGAYTMPWIDQVDAVIQMWYPGQEEGNAEAALIFGDVNPSGKLPVTFGKRRQDFPATTPEEFPGIKEKVSYKEGIFVGYRYFEKNRTEPLFHFGHGLSYTTFQYCDLQLTTLNGSKKGVLKVSYTVTNTGSHTGGEVPQLYIGDIEASVERAKKELKGFTKVFLEPGESRTIEHLIDRHDLSFWDVDSKSWKAEEGEFAIMIGASSADIRLQDVFIYTVK